MKLIICFEDIYNYVTYNIMCNGLRPREESLFA